MAKPILSLISPIRTAKQRTNPLDCVPALVWVTLTVIAICVMAVGGAR